MVRLQVLAPLGRLDEATAQIQTALEAEPLSSTVNLHAAMVALQQLRTDNAISTPAPRSSSTGFPVRACLAGDGLRASAPVRRSDRRIQKAIQPLRQAAPGWQGLLAHALARAGRRVDAEMILADLQQCAQRRYVDSVLQAVATWVWINLRRRSIAWSARRTSDRRCSSSAIRCSTHFGRMRGLSGSWPGSGCLRTHAGPRGPLRERQQGAHGHEADACRDSPPDRLAEKHAAKTSVSGRLSLSIGATRDAGPN